MTHFASKLLIYTLPLSLLPFFLSLSLSTHFTHLRLDLSAGDVKVSPLFDGGGDKWEGLLLDFGGWMWPGILEKVVGVVAKGLEGRVQLIGQLPIQHLKVN